MKSLGGQGRSGLRIESRASRIEVALLVACLPIGGCSSKAEQARKRYEFLKQQHASLGDVCMAGKALASAYADAQDTEKYQMADVEAGSDCLSADMNGAEQPYGEPPTRPDNMEAAR